MAHNPYAHVNPVPEGAIKFSLSLSQGRNLYALLRNELPGWALPQYIIDIPQGHGKTSAFNPESFKYSGNLMNRFGKLIPVNIN